MTQKDQRNLIAEYQHHGFQVVMGGRHWKVYDGPRLVMVFSGSQCGGRADHNAKATLRRVIRHRHAVAA
jgi:hypothetical protein